MKRDKSNYPPYKQGHSVHHVAYPYASYTGYEHTYYQNNPSLLIQAPNVRHNVGRYALHTLLDNTIGAPPKPDRYLMNQAIEFMQWQDACESRIKRLGQVIGFFIETADTHYKPIS